MRWHVDDVKLFAHNGTAPRPRRPFPGSVSASPCSHFDETMALILIEKLGQQGNLWGANIAGTQAWRRR
jgi:hypothetical protein